MSTTKNFINDSNLRIVYYRYKLFLYPVGIIVICLFIFFQFIIPQFQQFFILQTEITDNTQKLNLMKQNLDSLSLIDENSLNTKLRIVTSAVPAAKDYIGILSSISNAANSSGISISDYSFQVGDLNASTSTDPTVPLTFTLTGKIEQVESFLVALKKQIPLSTIKELSITDPTTTQITMQFYAKPFASISVDDTQTLRPLSPNEEDTINQISGYLNQNTSGTTSPTSSQ